MDAPRITLDIDTAAALVLFEMLTRYDDGHELPIEDEDETYALWLLSAELERRLVHPLTFEYARRLSGARAELQSRYGEHGS